MEVLKGLELEFDTRALMREVALGTLAQIAGPLGPIALQVIKRLRLGWADHNERSSPDRHRERSASEWEDLLLKELSVDAQLFSLLVLAAFLHAGKPSATVLTHMGIDRPSVRRELQGIALERFGRHATVGNFRALIILARFERFAGAVSANEAFYLDAIGRIGAKLPELAAIMEYRAFEQRLRKEDLADDDYEFLLDLAARFERLGDLNAANDCRYRAASTSIAQGRVGRAETLLLESLRRLRSEGYRFDERICQHSDYNFLDQVGLLARGMANVKLAQSEQETHRRDRRLRAARWYNLRAIAIFGRTGADHGSASAFRERARILRASPWDGPETPADSLSWSLVAAAKFERIGDPYLARKCREEAGHPSSSAVWEAMGRLPPSLRPSLLAE